MQGDRLAANNRRKLKFLPVKPETIRKAIRAGIEAEISGGDLARRMVGETETEMRAAA